MTRRSHYILFPYLFILFSWRYKCKPWFEIHLCGHIMFRNHVGVRSSEGTRANKSENCSFWGLMVRDKDTIWFIWFYAVSLTHSFGFVIVFEQSFFLSTAPAYTIWHCAANYAMKRILLVTLLFILGNGQRGPFLSLHFCEDFTDGLIELYTCLKQTSFVFNGCFCSSYTVT